MSRGTLGACELKIKNSFYTQQMRSTISDRSERSACKIFHTFFVVFSYRRHVDRIRHSQKRRAVVPRTSRVAENIFNLISCFRRVLVVGRFFIGEVDSFSTSTRETGPEGNTLTTYPYQNFHHGCHWKSRRPFFCLLLDTLDIHFQIINQWKIF